MTEVTPRISAAYLEQFSGQPVRIIGKVVQLRGDHATVDAGGQVGVVLNRDSHLQVGNAYEMLGKVNNDLTLKLLASTDFGQNLDFNAVDAVVDATHRYKSIFYGDD